ncbi:MAG TPA: hypothetical protein VGK46_03945, partial [Saprospiraceae bacterium]
FDLVIHDGDLYMAGDFTDAGGNADADGIARWDGSAWQNMGTGIQVASYTFVYNLVSDASGLYAGGPFVDAGGNPDADYVAKWNGSEWINLGNSPLGIFGLYAICEFDGSIYTTVGAGWSSTDGIYRFDNATENWEFFQPMELGADDPLLVLAADESNLYVGGFGFVIDGQDYFFIARYGEPENAFTISGVPNELCQTDAPVSLLTTQGSFTGTWSGPGVINNTFDPLGLDGEINITFTPYNDWCFDSADFIISVSNCYTPPPIDWIWAKAISGDNAREGNGIPLVYGITTDASKASYTCGYFYGEVDFDPGPNEFLISSVGAIDGFVCKLDTEGNFVWAKHIGGEGSGVIVYSIDTDETGHVFITGGFSYYVDFDPGPQTHFLYAYGESDIFILKLNQDGEFQWVKNIGGALGGCWGSHLTIEENTGNIYTTGTHSGFIDFDPGPGTFILGSNEYSIFISKLDSLGNFIWAKEILGPTIWSFTGGTSIAIDQASGNVYTAGHFYGTCDFDPGPGIDSKTSNGDADVFLLKLDNTGNYKWARAFGGTDQDYCPSVALGKSGNEKIYLSGGYSGTVDFDPGPGVFNLTSTDELFICKLDSAGHYIWAKSLGGSGGLTDFTGSFLVVDTLRNENVMTVGGFAGTADFDPGTEEYYLNSNGAADIFVSKIDSSGNFLWVETAGGNSNDYSVSLALLEDGKMLTTGQYNSPTLSFDGSTLTNVSDPNVFVAKLGGCNTVVTSFANSGAGTLRDIIQCAQSGDLVTFSLPSMSQITLTTGEIIINKDLSIIGPGISELTISGNNMSRIFNLTTSTDFHVEGLTLKDATAISNGGAILIKGNLTLRNALVQHNFQNGVAKSLTLSHPGHLTVKGMVDMKF